MSERNFFAELKRRNVYKVAVAYAVVGVAPDSARDSILFPAFEASRWAMKALLALVAAGFPIALVVAWAFELRRKESRGPTKSATRRGDAAVALDLCRVVGAALSIGLFFLGRYSASAPGATGARRQIDRRPAAW